ncbi:MAG: sugar ABC transporter permease, partial [Bacillaceae bacterium]|nr:sugar ABC transporter permease [Bacillaceae bacterium]
MGKKLYRQWPYILLVFFAFLFLSPFLIMLIGSFVKMRTVVG